MDTANDLYISKPLTFKYTFRVNKVDYDFYQIKRDLSHSLADYSEKYRGFKNIDREEFYNNATYFVLNDLFQKRFLFSGNTNAYLTDYT